MLIANIAESTTLNCEVMAMNQELVMRNQQLLDTIPNFVELSQK